MMPVDGKLLRLCQEVERARVLCAYAEQNLVRARRELSERLAWLKSTRKGRNDGEGQP